MTFLKSTFNYTIPFILMGLVITLLPVLLLTEDVSVFNG